MNSVKIFLYGIILSASSAHATVNTYFNQIKKDPKALYAFLKQMPKGGELHYHLAGGPSPETMLALASNSEYCINKNTFIASNNEAVCSGVKIKEIQPHSKLYTDIIKDWSMKDFVPGKESGHDHFFKGFMKYMALVFDYRPQLVANVITRAAEQEEQYLELMDIPDNGHALSFGPLLDDAKTFDQKKAILLNNTAFQDNINHTIHESDRTLSQARKHLGCDKNPDAKACQVTIKFIYYTLREQPLNTLFAQALNAFEAVSRSKGTLVGVNLVQPEDGEISLRDYHKHMQLFHYLHTQYPNVPIALHAGELAPKMVSTKALAFHIEDALRTGNAQRIGHGVDIMHETHAKTTLEYMATHHLPVEINLISNQKILNISGNKHPLKEYLANQVPVVLSTDDEGVLRTNLTQQYVEAATIHGLDYPHLKQINRNALTYAFLPGKSIWEDAGKGIRIKACHPLSAPTCMRFIKDNKKAAYQWQLEQKLIAFEHQF